MNHYENVRSPKADQPWKGQTPILGTSPSFFGKTYFFEFSQKKYLPVDISSLWWQKKVIFIVPQPDRQYAQTILSNFFWIISSTRYEIKGAKHIIKNLLLWNFEIQKKIYIIRIS